MITIVIDMRVVVSEWFVSKIVVAVIIIGIFFIEIVYCSDNNNVRVDMNVVGAAMTM